MTEDLRTTKDVARVRANLLEEQNGLDACTGLPIPKEQAVLDHCHDDEQFVRAVLHRQTNAAIGKIENFYKRLLAFWYSGTLPDFLRQAADYLEKQPDTRYRHPGWMKKAQTKFNKLSASNQRQLLQDLGQDTGNLTNLTDRKKAFAKSIRQKNLPAGKILSKLDEYLSG